MPIMGGALVNLPNPVKPTKQTTPVAPPLPSRLVNVPTQQGRVVNKATQDQADQILKLNDEFERASRGNRGDEDVVLRKANDLFAKIQDPKIKMRYEQQVQGRSRYARSIEEARREAAGDLNRLYSHALQTGFKPEILGEIDEEILDDIEYLQLEAIAATTTPERLAKKEAEMEKTIRSMDVPTQRTLLSLAPGWTGSYDELINAARSLSK
jgi:hypothetical protein